MSKDTKGCKKGAGTKGNDKCYWHYNGQCIRPDGEPCYYSIVKKKAL